MEKVDSLSTIVQETLSQTCIPISSPRYYTRQRTIQNMGPKALRNNLKSICENALLKVKKHADMSMVYRTFYFSMGGLQVLLSVIATAMSGSRSFAAANDSLIRAIFVFSILGTVLSALLNFFGIEKKISDHHTTKCQYYDVNRDTAHFLRVEQTEDSMYEFEGVIVEREKFIQSYEPPLSYCCMRQ